MLIRSMKNKEENSKREPKLLNTIIGYTRMGWPGSFKCFTCSKCNFPFSSLEINYVNQKPPSKNQIENYGKCPKCEHKNIKVLIFDTNDEYDQQVDKLPKVSERDIKNWVANEKADFDKIKQAKAFFSPIISKRIILDDTETFMYHSPLSKPERAKWWEIFKYIKIFKT